MRLVLYNPLAYGEPPVGMLYAPDAAAFSTALWRFGLEPDQELPRLKPRAIVDAGEIREGSDTSIGAGDVTVRARAIAKNFSTYPIFADDGATLAHPSIDGYRSASRSFLATTGALPPELGAELIGSWPARRALASARRARVVDAVAMMMRLVWTVGDGHGPVAVARLWPVDAEFPITIVPVMNVPRGYDPRDAVPVRVHANDPRAPHIVDGDVELWPLDFGRIADPRR